jgi:hypothetical protein
VTKNEKICTEFQKVVDDEAKAAGMKTNKNNQRKKACAASTTTTTTTTCCITPVASCGKQMIVMRKVSCCQILVTVSTSNYPSSSI